MQPARWVDTLAEHPFLAALAQQPFAPPEPTAPGVPAVAPAELREMLRRGLVVSQDGVIFPAAAVGGR